MKSLFFDSKLNPSFLLWLMNAAPSCWATFQWGHNRRVVSLRGRLLSYPWGDVAAVISIAQIYSTAHKDREPIQSGLHVKVTSPLRFKWTMSATKCPFLSGLKQTVKVSALCTCEICDVVKGYLPPCTPGSGSAQTWRTHWRFHPHPAAASSWLSWVPEKQMVKYRY